MDAFKNLQKAALAQLPESFGKFLTDPAYKLRRRLVAGVVAPALAASLVLVPFKGQGPYEAQAPPEVVEKIFDLDTHHGTVDFGLTDKDRADTANVANVADLKARAGEQFLAAVRARDSAHDTRMQIDWCRNVLALHGAEMDEKMKRDIVKDFREQVSMLPQEIAVFEREKHRYQRTIGKLAAMGHPMDYAGLDHLADLPSDHHVQDLGGKQERVRHSRQKP